MHRFTSVTFRNYKRFRQYSIALNSLNILVGANNAGKSTVIQAFRILAEGMRRARTRKPELLKGPTRDQFGYRLNLRDLAIATENVFTDYDETQPSIVKFRISNGNHLILHFPAPDACNLFAETTGKPIHSPTGFKADFDCDVAFVPVLGPLEHGESLLKKEAARLALISHGASRNFRNIWYHYPENFDEFRRLLVKTWPGMDVDRPTLNATSGRLDMFCREGRILREVFWTGFGFQVWCQMLTFIVEGQNAALLAIDEPDIYLHSDLQRQLIRALVDLGPDILIATHSTEIVAEAEPNDIVVVSREGKSGKRLQNPASVQEAFHALGSNLNPTLTQLAKTKRALFVEGNDFQIISAIAARLGCNRVANRSHFAVIQAHGFNAARVADMSEGIEATLGTRIERAAIFDRDYRSEEEVENFKEALTRQCKLVRIHGRKELENFLLVASALERATEDRLSARRLRTGDKTRLTLDVPALLSELADKHRVGAHAQYIASYRRYHLSQRRGVDDSVLLAEAIAAFEGRWSSLEGRLALCPGKQLLADINGVLMRNYAVSLSSVQIAKALDVKDIPSEMRGLIEELERF